MTNEECLGNMMCVCPGSIDACTVAAEYVLAHVDAMIAIWDGAPSGGHGGIGEVVAAARE